MSNYLTDTQELIISTALVLAVLLYIFYDSITEWIYLHTVKKTYPTGPHRIRIRMREYKLPDQ